jgi:DNA-binding winged helix-turn-helix (wHTH) protein
VSSKKLRFDGWLLDPDSVDLGRIGARIRLQEQPALVLRELATQAGSWVTREHLIALLWPKGAVDFDTGLNTAIRKLRSALGDTSETPRYLETLPRRGYRLIGSVDLDLEGVSSAAPSANLPISHAVKRHLTLGTPALGRGLPLSLVPVPHLPLPGEKIGYPAPTAGASQQVWNWTLSSGPPVGDGRCSWVTLDWKPK